LFHELAPTDDGPKAVVGWRTFLTRLNAMRSGEDRKDTRAKDHAALALLAERGLNEAELSRIEKLVRIAEGTESDFSARDDEAAEMRLERLKKLWAWYSQWASVARVEVKSRALRIRLGLAKRRKPKAEEPDDGEETDPVG
jgi:transposase